MSSWRSWFFGFLMVAALVGIVLHFGEIRNFARLLNQVEPIWLLVALLLQLSTYVSLALAWRSVLTRSENRQFRLGPLARIALSKLFADQAMPTAGMSGNVVLVDQLIRLGAKRGTAAATLLLSMLGFYTAYLVFALIALLLLWLHGQATPLMVGLMTTFLLVSLAIPTLALWLRHRGSKPLPQRVEAIRPVRQLLTTIGAAPTALLHDRGLILRVALCNGAVFAADIATLWACLQGLGADVPTATALLAFILASIVVTL